MQICARCGHDKEKHQCTYGPCDVKNQDGTHCVCYQFKTYVDIQTGQRFFTDWKLAHSEAQARANNTGLDTCIRRAMEYNTRGFLVTFACKADSDYHKVEIVRPTN